MPGDSLSALPANLLSLFAPALLTAVAWVLGTGLLRRLTDFPFSSLERALFAVGLGLGTLSTASFLVGLCGAYSTASHLAIVIGAVLVGAALMRGSAPRAPEDEGKPSLPPLWCKLVALLGALFLAGLLPSVLTPMVDPDGLAYHVAAPKRWLELGAIVPLPTHLHTLWPMGEEMLNGFFLALAGGLGCKPMVFAFAILGGLATYALGARLANRHTGVLAAVVLLYRAGAPSINTTSVEMPLTFFLVLAAVAICCWMTDASEGRGRMIILAGLMTGFACATKLTGLLCLAFLAGCFLVLQLMRKEPRKSLLSNLTILVGVAMLCAAPWLVRAWWITGNPVSPFAFTLLGGAAWSVEAERRLSLYFKTFDLQVDDLATRAAIVRNHLLKLTALACFGLAVPGSPRWVRGFILAAGLFAVVQVAISDNARFLLPATPFAAIALGWWLSRLAEKWSLLGWLWVAALGALMLPKTLTDFRTIPAVVWGGQSREAFIRHYVNNRAAFLWANDNLPSEARILYGPDNRTCFLRRDSYWSSSIFQQDIRYGSTEELNASLQAAGIEWLIYNPEMFEKEPSIRFETIVGWRGDERLRLEEAAAQGEAVFSADGVTVYKLR
jgi:hypothetical protein